MAVIGFSDGKAILIETAPGVSIGEVMAVTEAELVVPDTVPRNEDSDQVTDMRIFSDFQRDQIRRRHRDRASATGSRVTQDRINQFCGSDLRRAVDPCRPGARQKRNCPAALPSPHGPVVARAPPPLFIRSVIGLKGLRNTLNYGADRITVSGARFRRIQSCAGRVTVAEAEDVPPDGLRVNYHPRDRDRRRQAPRLRRRIDRPALSLKRCAANASIALNR